MKSMKVIVAILSILIVASCGQTGFVKKKYLNLKPIEEVKPEQESVRGNVVEKTVNYEEVILEESETVIGEIKESNESEISTSQNALVEGADGLSKDDFSRTSLIEESINDGTNEGLGIPKSTVDEEEGAKADPIVRDTIIVSVIELVLFISLIAFILFGFTYGFSVVLAISVIGAIALLMIAVGIFAIIKGKRGLDKKDRVVKNIIFSIASIVVGGIGIIAGAIGFLNGLFLFLFEY